MRSTNGISQDFISKPETLRNIVNHSLFHSNHVVLEHSYHAQLEPLFQVQMSGPYPDLLNLNF